MYEILEPLKNILEIMVLIIGGLWGIYKFKEYRELKHWIQFEIDANIYKLNSQVKINPFILTREGEPIECGSTEHTHAVEVLLKFVNKGKTRVRIYNMQTTISTMPENVKLDQLDRTEGHLRLITLFRSGNIVPERTIFYYIEPGVEQTISYLTLIGKPRELLRVQGKFSFEEERIFPEQFAGSKGLLPHTAERTYKLDSEGCIQKVNP